MLRIKVLLWIGRATAAVSDLWLLKNFKNPNLPAKKSMLILEGKFGSHVKLSYRKRKSSEILAHLNCMETREAMGYL